jgi:phosphoribosyl 1,2-cyclic phosphodiesterase
VRMKSLQSGSNGNCVFVEADGVRLLIDAGISGVQMQERLEADGIDPRTIDALLITHDHSDHVRCMGVYHRKYGVPVYVTQATLMAARGRSRLGLIDKVRCFSSGDRLQIGGVTVETVPTPHDGVDGVGFVIDDGRRRLGILTDLGHAFSALRDVLQSLDAVLLESNYDPHMLANGPYPEFLKARIRGSAGHLSNLESAQLLESAVRGRLAWACLGHLSEHNNEPELALATHRTVLGTTADLRIAGRYVATEFWEV